MHWTPPGPCVLPECIFVRSRVKYARHIVQLRTSHRLTCHACTMARPSLSITLLSGGFLRLRLQIILIGLAASGCSHRLQNGAAPAITTQPQSQAVTAPATATFTVTATRTAPIIYQWRKGGTAIGGATSPNYTTPATAAGDDD